VLEVLYHHSKLRGPRISLATVVAKNVEFFLTLCVCLSVMLLNDRDCAHDFAMKTLEYKGDFDTIGNGKVCSCVFAFNLLCMLPLATSQMSKSKNGKICSFLLSKCDRMNRSRQNMARKHRL